MTKEQKKTENSSFIKPLDMSEMNEHIMNIAERSKKLLENFMRHGDLMKQKAKKKDSAHLVEAFTDFIKQTAKDPHKLVDAQINYWQDYVALLKSTLAQAGGEETDPIISPAKGDNRFKDDDWEANWVFNYIKQSYLLTCRWAHEQIDHIDGIDALEAHKVRFYAGQMLDAMSPTNFALTNPEVIRETIESKGENLLKGLENLLADMEKGAGKLKITMSDHSKFELGGNIACTKGKVIYQNELMQLIQYSPRTDTVKKTPMLILPPWINKYYILDLKPKDSFVGHLVDQGHTVFLISWINPDGKHRHLGFDDYMTLGPISALQEIKKVTGEDEVNCTAYCIGGTLLASTLAMLEATTSKPEGLPKVASATYLTSMVDFFDVGDLAVFIDEEQIQMVEDQMKETGYLPGAAMASTFSMLNANNLIWGFVVNNYMLGKDPFPFDMLTWNSDSTNMTEKMHSYYLRNMYLENNLVKPDKLVMNGTPIDLRKITTPSFLLSTHDDHIAPWRTTYAATQIYSGPITFCLSGSGHIAGAMNSPTKTKYGYWINGVEKYPADPQEWFDGAEKQEGSWWPQWIKWLDQHSGAMVDARDPEKNDNVIEDAPGSYVRGSLFD